MRHFATLIALSTIVILSSCRGKAADSDVVYEYEEEVPQLSAELQEKIGSWAEQGATCYGLLALIDKEGVIQEGAVIKAKIIRFQGDSIKMRSLTDVKLKEVQGCDKMGISRGQTWWETEGEIFETAEEAKVYLEGRIEEQGGLR